MKGLEVTAYRDRFRDDGAIVERERRNPPHRVDRGIRVGAML
jgi:hypothetical protein